VLFRSYRLLPNYLYAVVQGLIFAALFAPHLKHPLVAGTCLLLFQIACFHLAAGASIFAGTLPEHLHYRIRWMMLGVFSLLTALYFHVAWEIKLVPGFLTAPLAQLLFYPAVTLPDAAGAPALHRWAQGFSTAGSFSWQEFWQPALALGGFALAAWASLGWLLRLKANLFEPSLATSTATAERRLRLKQGRGVVANTQNRRRSAGLPSLPFFQGVGAIVWKNLVMARRSRRELLEAVLFTVVYTGMLVALLWHIHGAATRTGRLSAPDVNEELRKFNLGIAIFIGVLAFFLQRLFPFDFRRDGHHLLGFRTLPLPPVALVLAEVTVPTVFVLGCQAVGLLALLVLGRVEWPLLLLFLFAYPAIALALNSVWNLHYLLTAAKRAGGQGESPSAVGTLMVVVLSFLVFFPAGWTTTHISKELLPAATAAVGLQYIVDFTLILVLARLFQRYEVARDG